MEILSYLDGKGVLKFKKQDLTPRRRRSMEAFRNDWSFTLRNKDSSNTRWKRFKT